MKTTIDLPEDLLHRAKIVAAQRKTTLKELVRTGLDWVMRPEATLRDREEALAHLRKGLHLGGEPLTRDQAHERHKVPRYQHPALRLRPRRPRREESGLEIPGGGLEQTP